MASTMAPDVRAATPNLSPGSKYAHLGFGDSLERARRTVAQNTISKWEEQKAQRREDQHRQRRLKAEESMTARRREEELKRTGEEHGQKLLEALRSEVMTKMEAQYRDEAYKQAEMQLLTWQESFRQQQREEIADELRLQLEPVVKAELTLQHMEEVKMELRESQRAEVIEALREECIDNVKSEVRAELSTDMHSEVVERLREEHLANVVQTLRWELRDEVLQQLRDELKSQPAEGGCNDSTGLSAKNSSDADDPSISATRGETSSLNGVVVNGSMEVAMNGKEESLADLNREMSADHKNSAHESHDMDTLVSQRSISPLEQGNTETTSNERFAAATTVKVVVPAKPSFSGFAPQADHVSYLETSPNLKDNITTTKRNDYSFHEEIHPIKFSSPLPQDSASRKRSLTDSGDDAGSEEGHASFKRLRKASFDAGNHVSAGRPGNEQYDSHEGKGVDGDGVSEVEGNERAAAEAYGRLEESNKEERPDDGGKHGLEGDEAREGDPSSPLLPYAGLEEEDLEEEYELEEDQVAEQDSNIGSGELEDDEQADVASLHGEDDGLNEREGSLRSVSEQSDGFENGENDRSTDPESYDNFATAQTFQSDDILNELDDLTDGSIGYESEGDEEESLEEDYDEAGDAAQRVISFTNTHETPIELDDTDEEDEAT